VTGLLFGLAPAWRSSRVDLLEAIKQSVHSNFRPLRWKLRDLLVVSQIALGFVLVIGTVLLSKSLVSLINVDPGFDSHNVLTLAMVVYGKHNTDWDTTMNYYRQVRQKVEAIPGVEDSNAKEVPVETRSYPTAEPIGVSAGGGTYQVIQLRLRSVGLQCPTYAEGTRRR
jgi:putative ABC transport system permease protein